MLETVAIMGPARFGIPLTQAISAPVLGRLEERAAPPVLQMLACAGLRLLHTTITTAFFIFVITGGLDAYAGTYDVVAERVGIEGGSGFALAVTAAGLLAWAAFASTVQVLVYRRGMARHAGAPTASTGADAGLIAAAGQPRDAAPTRRRFDPRAVALAAAIAFTLLLVSTSWPVLGACAAWLAVAWALARGDRRAVPAGVVLAAMLGGSAFVFSLVGGLGIDVALRRLSRAALLVAVATWLRSAAGSRGLREVSRRALGRLRRMPAVPEAARAMGDLGSERNLRDSGAALLVSLRGVRRRPLPIVDAVLSWGATEAARFRPPGAAAPLALSPGSADALLLALSLAPLVAAVAA